MTGLQPTRSLADEVEVVAALQWAIQQAQHQKYVVRSPRSGISSRTAKQMCAEYDVHAKALLYVLQERKVKP